MGDGGVDVLGFYQAGELLIGLDACVKALQLDVLGGGMAAVIVHLVACHDIEQQLVEEGQGAVAAHIDQQSVEDGGADEEVHIVTFLNEPLQSFDFLPQARDRFGRGLRGEAADDVRLDSQAGLIHIRHGRALGLQDVAGIARDQLHLGLMHPRARTGSAHHADQAFGLENAKGFAQGGSGNAERGHKLAFGRQGVALAQLAPNDLTTNVIGDDFRGFRDTNPAGSLARCRRIVVRHPLALHRIWFHLPPLAFFLDAASR